jgi:formylmethanofuran dehydrogenase subunit E
MLYLIRASIRDPRKYQEAHKHIKEHAKSNARLKNYFIAKDGKTTYEIWETNSRDWLKNHLEKHAMGSASFELTEVDERMFEQQRKAA